MKFAFAKVVVALVGVGVGVDVGVDVGVGLNSIRSKWGTVKLTWRCYLGVRTSTNHKPNTKPKINPTNQSTMNDDTNLDEGRGNLVESTESLPDDEMRME